MNINYYKTLLLLILVTAGTCLPAWSQVSISGPACVMPGAPYQYLINGQWDSASTMQVCANGAVILGSTNTCTANGSPVAAVSVTWSAGLGVGGLSLTSTSGNATLSVTITRPLQAGAIDTGGQTQNIGFNLAPVNIPCGPDTGGTCKPVYMHQWQSSPDNVHWTDISGATGQNLTGIAAQKQTIFYRRKTVETVTGGIAYSNSAEVFVGPPPPGTTAAQMN